MDDFSKQFKALAHKSRLAIFEYLRQQGSLDTDGLNGANPDVSGIAAQFDLALSTISHHLRILHEAGLIKCVQREKHTFCVVDVEAVEKLRAFLSVIDTSEVE